jgi:hypothetical protein
MGARGNQALVASAALRASREREPWAVEECMRRNLPERASVRGISLLSVDRTGSQRKLTGKLYWKRLSADRSGLLMRLDSPPDVRRSSYLVLQDGSEEQMFVYLPNMQRVRRIHPDTASGSLFGTDFSYADLRYLQMMESIVISERLEDGVVGERPAYHVRMRAKPGEKSPYDRVDAMIDQTASSRSVLEAAASEAPDRPSTASPERAPSGSRGRSPCSTSETRRPRASTWTESTSREICPTGSSRSPASSEDAEPGVQRGVSRRPGRCVG